MEERDRGVILLRDLLQGGIHIEQAFDFRTSVFFKTYEDLRKSVQGIVKENRKRKREMQRSREPQEIGMPNVISVIGRRGTGKSSVMLSFREALERYKKSDGYLDCGDISFSKGAEMEDVRFFALDYIDASVLEDSEDIFILVLANMIAYLDRNMKDAEKNEMRVLMHQFEILHKDFLTVKESTQRREELYSSLETLDNVAGSQKIKRQFYKLVGEFLQYVSWKSGIGGRELYLVISIDDLDMAHYNSQNKPTSCVNNKSYEIVNSICKYLSVPGVIVLASYNHVNLLLQNENFFINSDTTDYHTEYDRTAQRKTSARLANQFVDKVFSPAYRTYMPSWKKSDYQKSQFLIDVWTGMEGDSNVFTRYIKKEGQCLTIRRLLLLLYWVRMGIAYDCEGQKLHFLEPDSMRRLSDAILLFDDDEFPLVEIQENEEKQNCRKAVFRKIKGDIYYHFVTEKLYLPEEKEFFDELMELRIDRRSEVIVRKASRITKPLGKEARKREKVYRRWVEKLNFSAPAGDLSYMERVFRQINDNTNVRYSFAELVHAIYHMSREEGGYSREFVACILHSYTIYLSELYGEYRRIRIGFKSDELIRWYRKNDSQDSADGMDAGSLHEMKRIYDIFCGVIGDAVFGHWCEYYFPEVYTEITGARKGGNKYTERVILGCSNLNTLTFSVFLPKKEEEFEVVVKEVIFLISLCSNVLSWEELIGIAEKISAGNRWRISMVGDQDIEMAAFIKYAFQYPDFLNKVEGFLTDMINKMSEKKDWGEVQEVYDRMKEAVTNVCDELWKKFEAWDRTYGNMVLPLHNFDCSYNLIKHLFQETYSQEEAAEITTGSQFFTEFLRMNERILSHLENIDQFYENQQGSDSFAEIYKKCPFMELVEELAEDDRVSNDIAKNIAQIIGRISAERKIEVPADEEHGKTQQGSESK